MSAVAGPASAAPLEPQNPGLVYYRPTAKPEARTMEADFCIYGGNSAGVAAALQASRMGKTSIILEPGRRLGGLSAGGLGETDIGNKRAIGGISRDFYKRVGQKYGVEEEWKFEPRIAEQVFQDMVKEAKAPVFFDQYLKSVQKKGKRLEAITMESGLTVRAKTFIDATYEGDLMAKAGVKYHVGREANSVYDETLNGVQVRKAHQFSLPVDPYILEGDPKSGLLPGINPGDPGKTGDGDHRVQAYNFRLCLTNDPANRIPFEKPIGYDPKEYVLLARYLAKGWPESEVFKKFDPIRNSATRQSEAGLLEIDKLPDLSGLIVKLHNAGGPLTRYLKEQLTPETRAQVDAYTGTGAPPDVLRRAVVDELNKLLQGDLLYTEARFSQVRLSPAVMERIKANPTGEERLRLNRLLFDLAYPNEVGRYLKVDKNNHGAISTDFIGRNYDYPNGDYATRERIFQEHVRYQKGLMWFMGNDPSVPETIRTKWSQWGLPKDEFLETGGWPHQLYVREARRMISDYVMTEHDCRGKRVAEDPVGLAAYTMDSHNCQRFVRDGRVMNEGDVQVGGMPPYPISYRSIVPKKAECENLLVPVCLAASHIAYGSIRMEPVFMIMGQSAATAAAMSIDAKIAVQDVPYPALRERLLQDGQILAWQPADATPAVQTPPRSSAPATSASPASR